jgi:DeoR family fructose operon transcriptional repressor
MKERGGFITVGELCGLLYASESSVRRDLTRLERHGVLKRVYGGAELITNFSSVVSFGYRSHENVAEKKIVAKKSATLIKDGDVIFIDQSSIALYLCHEILENTTLTVVTNNVEILSLLSQSKMEVLSCGGRLSRSNRNCLLGGDAAEIFRHIRADILFFSTRALAPEGVLYDADREEIRLRQVMLENAVQKVYLCAAEKFGQYAGFRQCHLDDVDFVITEAEDKNLFSPLGKMAEKIV